MRRVAAGIAAAAAERPVESLLFGLLAARSDHLRGGRGVLIGVALLASYLPARRASRLEPTEALSEE